MNDTFKKVEKLDNPPWSKKEDLNKLINILGKDNIKLVGGVVRDAIRGDKIKDIDLTTSILPEKVKVTLAREGYKIIDFAESHGTILAISKTNEYQITTLRQDIKTDGRYAKVKFTSSFIEDASRRDFTINALYSDFDGNIFDPKGGLKDLSLSKARFIGDPYKRIKEDYLRVLRYFRFLAYYTSNIKDVDLPSMNACIQSIENIKNISKERLSNEFLKLLEGKNLVLSLKVMKDNNILNYIIAGLDKITKKSILKINKLPNNNIIRLAYLIISSDLNYLNVVSDLRLSNKIKNELRVITSNKIKNFNEKNIKKNIYYMGRVNAKNNYIISSNCNGIKIDAKIIEILELWELPFFPLKGQDIIKLGIKESKKVGDILNTLETWWVEKDFKNNKYDCLNKIKELLLDKV